VTGSEKKKELTRYRMQQAAESLDEARFLQVGGKSSRSVVNRAYYAIYSLAHSASRRLRRTRLALSP